MSPFDPFHRDPSVPAPSLAEALGSDDPHALGAALVAWGGEGVRPDARDAAALRDALHDLRDRGAPSPNGERLTGDRLQRLVEAFGAAAALGAGAALRDTALPALISLYDLRLPAALSPAFDAHRTDRDELVMLLREFARYRTRAGTDRVLAAARTSLANGFLWGSVFDQYRPGHPHRDWLREEFWREPPRGFAAVAYLEVCNAAARETGPPGAGGAERHGFDSPAGRERLRSLIEDDWHLFGERMAVAAAEAAAAAAAFLSEPGNLPELAAAHPDDRVRLAGAAAALGRPGGRERLRAFARDPDFAHEAQRFLEELDRPQPGPNAADGSDVSSDAQSEERARAEMLAHLCDPAGYGAPPTRLTLLDTRELHWPPTNDRRRLWLFEYAYQTDPDDGDPEDGDPEDGDGDEGDEDEAEVALSLIGGAAPMTLWEESADLSPEDALGLFCARALLCANDDPFAPVDPTAAGGRARLRVANPGAGF